MGFLLERPCKEGTLWKLQGDEEDFYWSLKEVGEGLKPQEKLSLQEKIIAYFKKSPQAISLSKIATKIGTSYECVRRNLY